MHDQICRVCGIGFRSRRFDAVVCSDTCRQRLRRGGDLAYLETLSKSQQRIERELHAAHAEYIAARDAVAARRNVRARRREERQAQERTRALAEILGRGMLARAAREAQAQEQRERQKFLGSVAMAVKLFTQEGREVTAEAVAAFLESSMPMSTDAVAEALAEIAVIESA